MTLQAAVKSTLRSQRFWLWQIAGAIIYLIPVAIRFATNNVAIPLLNFPGFWIGHFIPGNLVEKILVNAFFPGGAGGVAGEVFFSHYKGAAQTKKTLYLYRLAGALLQTAAWSLFQFVGYSLAINGPYGSNLFEFFTVFPINFVLAACSIFTPTVVGYAKSKLTQAATALS